MIPDRKVPEPEKKYLSGIEWSVYYALIHERNNAPCSNPERWGMTQEDFTVALRWVNARINELHAKKP